MPTNMIDLTGKKFGRLTVLKRGKNYVSRNGKIKVRWICRCECGNKRLICGSSLKDGKSRSCGCLRSELTSEANLGVYRTSAKDHTVNYYWNRVQNSAKRRKITFKLTKKDIENTIFQPCHYCGSKPNQEVPAVNSLQYSGIDRKDPKRGYVRDNIVPACWKCNKRKNNSLYTTFMDKIRGLGK